MSLPIPLAVRLVSVADKHVTADVDDLWFRSVAPGGFASLRIALNRPLSSQPEEIGYYGRIVFYDTRNGETVCEGRVEDPSPGVDGGGQMWRLSAVGPSAHAQDLKLPYVAVDQEMRAFVRANNVTPGGRDSIGDDPGGSGAQAIILQFPSGLAIGTSSLVAMRYNRLREAGQNLARVAYTVDSGRTDPNFQTELLTRQDAGAPGTAITTNWSTTAAGVSATVGAGITNGHNVLDLQIESDTTGTVGADDHWASIRGLAIRALLLDAAGNEITTGYTGDTVLASQIVADIVGRHLPLYDGIGASIATTTHPITQFAHPDGATARERFDDLIVLEPGFYWAAWERNNDGLHRFEWRAWPTEPRYEADVNDGYSSSASAADLYSGVWVRWIDPASGETRATHRTQTAPILEAAGITRETTIDLSTNLAGQSNAERAGDSFLAEHRYPPNAGRLPITRPVVDLATGRMAWPWEIRPGELIRVRGLLPNIDALNPTDRDGVTIFRIVAVEYSASQAAATLELDSRPRTTLVHELAASGPQRVLRRR